MSELDGSWRDPIPCRECDELAKPTGNWVEEGPDMIDAEWQIVYAKYVCPNDHETWRQIMEWGTPPT